jgi:hypothetical protein
MSIDTLKNAGFILIQYSLFSLFGSTLEAVLEAKNAWTYPYLMLLFVI